MSRSCKIQFIVFDGPFNAQLSDPIQYPHSTAAFYQKELLFITRFSSWIKLEYCLLYNKSKKYQSANQNP